MTELEDVLAIAVYGRSVPTLETAERDAIRDAADQVQDWIDENPPEIPTLDPGADEETAYVQACDDVLGRLEALRREYDGGPSIALVDRIVDGVKRLRERGPA